MFGSPLGEIGLSEDFLSSGESHDEDLGYRLTCLAMADGWVEDDRHLLPADLEHLPLAYLGVVVRSVDRTRLNGHDAIRLMQAEARLESSHAAAKLATMAEVALSPPGDANSPVERSPSEAAYAACEIAAALTLTRRTAESQLMEAMSMTGRLSKVWERFANGDIDLRKTRDLVRSLGHLDQETIDTVLDKALGDAPNLTAGQLRARISRIVMETDPDGSRSSMTEGLEERHVTTHANPDFTGTLSVVSAHPMAIYRASRHIDDLARALKGAGDERHIDQIRADVAIDLLQGRCGCGKSKTSPGGSVHVTVELGTLTRLTDSPGHLDGYGPIISEIARKTVTETVDGKWTFQVTDNGRPLATGTLRRRPGAAQRRHLNAVHRTCVFPGCRMPSHDCDLDHRRPFSSGGPTHNDNLEPLCRHHHMMRHHAPWQLERRSDGGHVWTSPLRHTYATTRGPPD
jgi:Domain of unknown function (DUF222)